MTPEKLPSSFNRDTVASACRTILGRSPVEIVVFPPLHGRIRESARVRFGDASAIATRRADLERGSREARVLRLLRRRKCAVPRVLAYRDGWLFQEDLGEVRLSETLAAATEPECSRILDLAVESLASLPFDAEGSSMTRALPPTPGRTRVLAAAVELCRDLGVQPPPSRLWEVSEDTTAVRNVIKWDARPANAVLTRSGTVAWFDWVDCRIGDAAWDLVWFLADEWTPEFGSFPELLERAAPGPRGVVVLGRGLLHVATRLRAILAYHREGDWLGASECLRNDWIGVTPECVRRLCERSRRWSSLLGNDEVTSWATRLSEAVMTSVPSGRAMLGRDPDTHRV